MMTLRSYLQQMTDSKALLTLATPVSKTYEMAGILKTLEPRAVCFENVKDSPFHVIGNLVCSKASFAQFLGIPVADLLPSMIRAIDNRMPCPTEAQAPCQ